MPETYDVAAFRDTFEHEFTWINGFLRNVSRFSDRPALYDPEIDKRWTYGELNRDANKLAHALIADGARQGKVVMYMLPNSPEFALCYIATHKAGAINCPLNYRLSPGEISLQIDDSKPDIFIYDEDFAPTAEKALNMANHKPGRIIKTSRKMRDERGMDDFDSYMADRADTNPQMPIRQHIYDETCRFYTSGTTGKAKGVPINCINEVLSAHDVLMHFPLNETDRTMNMTPWFHRGGLHAGGLTPTFYAGGEVIVLRDFNPRKCLQVTASQKATFLIGVPSILALLARGQAHQPVDLSSLRGIVTMGSPLDKSACERYMRILTPNIFNGYGTTETFWNTFLRPGDLPDMAGSAGHACTDDDVRVVRVPEDGSHADPMDMVAKDNIEIGEIIIKAPAKSAGCYVNNDQMTRQKFHNGYHYTGDLGTWNHKEYVTVVSRKDDMILNAGENVYPSQIEGVLNEHPKVAEAAVIGIPDKLHGQNIAAYIVADDPTLTVDELKTFCLNHPMLPSFKRPRVFHIVDALPHTATGKLMHFKLRQQAAEKNITDQS